MAAPLLIAIFHYLVCAVGVTVNTVLLVIILTRTPQNLKSYSILLFSQTLTQATTCLASGILFARSERIAFYLWMMMLHGHAHYFIMLAVCFCYRYYVILNPTPKLCIIALLAVVVYLPTLITHTWTSQTEIYNETTARQLLSVRGASYVFDERDTVTGVVNVLEPAPLTTIVWDCAPCVPTYMIILGVSRAMSRTLTKNVEHMSDSTRASHREIVRGLIFQACLPAAYVFSITSYLLGQLNLLNVVGLEYATHITGEICVATSPFLTLYFVQPYRRTLRRVVRKKTVTVPVTSTTK